MWNLIKEISVIILIVLGGSVLVGLCLALLVQTYELVSDWFDYHF